MAKRQAKEPTRAGGSLANSQADRIGERFILKRISVAIFIFVILVGLVVIIVSAPQLFPFAAEVARGNGFVGEIHAKAGTPTGIAIAIAILLLIAALAWRLACKVVKA